MEQQGRWTDAIVDYESAIDSGEKELAKLNISLTENKILTTSVALCFNGFGWLLATCPRSEYHDGVNAVSCAKRACELTNWQLPEMFDTLAAAHARAGNFEEAIRWQTKALTQVSEEQKEDLQSRLDSYDRGEAYIQTIAT